MKKKDNDDADVACSFLHDHANKMRKLPKKHISKQQQEARQRFFVGKTLKLNAKTVGKKKKITYKTSKKSVATVNKKGVIQRKEIRNCQDHNESFWSENKEDHCICKKSSDRDQTFICTDDQFLQDRKHCPDQSNSFTWRKTDGIKNSDL